MEPTPFTIKLADQSKVAPLGLVKNVPVRIVGVRFLVAFVVMTLPSHNSSYSILLGRPWLRVASIMHDWKNGTLLLQSREGAVKVDLKDGKIRLVIPRNSEPSSSASTTTNPSIDTKIPSELSSDYVMNWIEALATIDCLMMSVVRPLEGADKNTPRQAIEEIPFPETPEEMLKAFQEDEQKEREVQEILDEENMLHLCYLAEPEGIEANNPSKEEAQSRHNVTLRTPKKARRAKTQVQGVITEELTEDELKAKIQEDVEGDPIPLRDVPQYFKDYTMDEVVIVMPQAVRPNQVEVQPNEDGVYDGPTRTKEIDLALEGETSKPIFIGEHLTRRRE